MENKIKLILLIGMPSSTDLGGCQNSILKFDIVFTPLIIYFWQIQPRRATKVSVACLIRLIFFCVQSNGRNMVLWEVTC